MLGVGSYPALILLFHSICPSNVAAIKSDLIMTSALDHNPVEFRPSRIAMYVMIIFCVLGTLGSIIFFGQPGLRSFLMSIPLDETAKNALLIGCIGVLFFAWMIWILIQTFSIIVSDRGVSGLVFRVAPTPEKSGGFLKRQSIGWHEITRVVPAGHELVITAGKARIKVNTIAFADSKSLAAYIDEMTSHLHGADTE